MDRQVRKRNFVTHNDEWMVMIFDKEEFRELKWLFNLIRKHDESNWHMIFEWKGEKALKTSEVMDPVYDYDKIETLHIKNMTKDAFFIMDPIDLTKYTNLEQVRIEQRYVSSKNSITDYDEKNCRKCNATFPNVRVLHNHYYEGNC